MEAASRGKKSGRGRGRGTSTTMVNDAKKDNVRPPGGNKTKADVKVGRTFQEASAQIQVSSHC